MKIAFISDIHANFEALYSMEDVLENSDEVICLGDIIGYYCQVNEVIDYLKKFKVTCMLGNHDNFMLNGINKPVSLGVEFGINFAKSVIRSDNYEWFTNLPLTLGKIVDGCSILMTHGSPWNPMEDYLYHNNVRLNDLSQFNYDIIAFGQTHRKFTMINEKNTLLINPGSIGQSRDGKVVANALVLDTKTMELEVIERKYNTNYVIEIAKKNGAGDWIYKHLI